MKTLVRMAVLAAALVAVGSAALAGERPGREGRGELRPELLERIKANAPPEIRDMIDRALAGEQLGPGEQQRLRAFARERMGAEMPGMGNLREQFRNDTPPDVRAILDKREQGNELTAEEQEKLRDYTRNRMNEVRERVQRGWGAQILPLQTANTPNEPPPVSANLRDAAFFRVADILQRQARYQEAVEVLAGVAAESPQPEVRGAAHLMIARICRKNLLLTDKAAEEFLAVRGPLAPAAFRELAEMYEQAGEAEKGITALRNAAAKAEEKPVKALLLKAVADACERAGQLENAVQALNEIAALVTYDEAMQMKDLFAPLDQLRTEKPAPFVQGQVQFQVAD